MTGMVEEGAAVADPEFSFGDRLRKARRHARLSQPAMAERMGIPASRLSNWESDVSKPREVVKVAKEVGRVTGVRVEWLLGLSGQGKTDSAWIAA